MRKKLPAVDPERAQVQPPNPSGTRRRFDWDWLVVLFAMLVLCQVVTDGDWDFFPRAGNMEKFYDAQAQSLLEGRIDVPPEAIQQEAFVKNGKYSGYFGPTPALARIPLNLLMPSMYGRWNRLSMLLGSLAIMASLILLFGRLERHLGVQGRIWWATRVTLLIAVVLGSTNLYISTESQVYQESLMWAAALTLAHAVFLVCYLMEPAERWLWLACAAAFFAFLAKVSSGAGALFSLLLLDLALLVPAKKFREFWGLPEGARGRRPILVVTMTLVASAALWAGLNYWKYGIVFTSQPLHLTIASDPDRLRRTKGNPASFTNIPLNFSLYVAPGNIQFARRFPWVFLMPDDPAVAKTFPAAHFDNIERYASLPATHPVLFLGALFGMLLCLFAPKPQLKLFRAPLCGTLAAGFLILTWGYITYRYLDDALPWLAMGTAVAMAQVCLFDRKWARLSALAVLATGAFYGIWLNSSFGLSSKRHYVIPGSDVKRLAFTDFSEAVDRRGLAGALDYVSHWRTYLPAAELVQGSVTAGNVLYTSRPDISLIWKDGPPAAIAQYRVTLPCDGVYEVAMLYASGESRPIHMSVNGAALPYPILGAATGGWSLAHERWGSAGLLRMPAGTQDVTLASEGKFPVVRMIRIVSKE
jgi:hypothetical protein